MNGIGKIVGTLVSKIVSDKKDSKVETQKKKKECHYGNVYAFSIGNVSIFGGGRSRGFDTSKVDILIPTLTGYDNAMGWRAAKMFPRFTAAMEHQIVIPIITTDFKPPVLTKEQWMALVEDLENIKDPMKALVFCVGGHGRTGTVLSVLYGLTQPNDGDPVEKIREIYCKEAVESTSQLNYIENMTGLKVEAAPSKSYSTTKLASYTSGTQMSHGNYYGRQPPLFSTPSPDELISNTVWADAQEHLVWNDSHRYSGYEYTHVDGHQYYRLKE